MDHRDQINAYRNMLLQLASRMAVTSGNARELFEMESWLPDEVLKDKLIHLWKEESEIHNGAIFQDSLEFGIWSEDALGSNIPWLIGSIAGVDADKRGEEARLFYRSPEEAQEFAERPLDDLDDNELRSIAEGFQRKIESYASTLRSIGLAIEAIGKRSALIPVSLRPFCITDAMSKPSDLHYEEENFSDVAPDDAKEVPFLDMRWQWLLFRDQTPKVLKLFEGIKAASLPREHEPPLDEGVRISFNDLNSDQGEGNGVNVPFPTG